MSKVLIVDDHPVIRMAMRVLLEKEGHVIVGETDNGVDALSLVKDLIPDLVVLDIGIPRLDLCLRTEQVEVPVQQRVLYRAGRGNILALPSDSDSAFADHQRP